MSLAVVTGAGGGIGRATARRLARDGYHLALCDIDAAALRATEQELGAAVLGSDVVDVADAEAVRRFAERVLGHGAPDVLVNNAGVGVAGPFVRTTTEDWQWIVGVNLLGPVNLCHVFLPAMIAAGRGHVVNVVSLLGYFAPPAVSPYVATKYALLGLSLSLRTELRQKGIRVSAVCPGLVDTNIVANSRLKTAGDQPRQRVQALFKRGRDPARVADAIAGLLVRDRAVLPVFPEAWALWYAGRISPDFGTALGRLLLRRVVGRQGVRDERDAMDVRGPSQSTR